MSDAPSDPELLRLQREKLAVDIRKVETEIAEIVRPWWKRASYLMSLVPIVAASLTLGQLLATGYYDGLRRSIEIDRKAALQDRDALNRERKELEKEQITLRDRIDGLRNEELALLKQSQAIAALTSAGVEVTQHGNELHVRFFKYDMDLRLADLVAELPKLRNVTWLSFTNTDLTDEMLTNVRTISTLQSLYLDRTQVTSKGLANLVPLSKLSDLSANLTPIDDGCRLYLAQLPQLRTLNLKSTKVTQAGIRSLKEILLDCVIQSDVGDGQN